MPGRSLAAATPASRLPARASVPARVGLVGHPSDAYGGATLAVTLANFAAHVDVRPAAALEIEPAGEAAWPEGGQPLVGATVDRFRDHCAASGVAFDTRVAIRYGSTIPRQVGLGGSSAIVIATLRALADSSGLPIDRERLPGLALSVETERLGIVAGLQDRVVQTYGGLVFMDFAADRHESLDTGLLPGLFVAWDPTASGRSGSAHAGIRARYMRGERPVVEAMRALGALARDARLALERGDHDVFAGAVDAGYDLRAGIFELDPRHTAMIDAARRAGLSATYTGSGGAIVGLPGDPAALDELGARLAGRGVRVVRAEAG